MPSLLSPWAKIGSWLSNNWASFSIIQYVGRTDEPRLEKEIVSSQASYGKQLNALIEVVALLVDESREVKEARQAKEFLALKSSIDDLKASKRATRIALLTKQLQSLLDEDKAEADTHPQAREAIARAKRRTPVREPA